MKFKHLLLPALLCAASVAHAGTVGAVSAGIQHADLGGLSLNQAVVSAQAQTGSIVYGTQFADGNHSGTDARGLSASAGYALDLKTPGLAIAPSVSIGYSRLGGSAQKHLAVGATVGYTLPSSKLTVFGSGFAGRAFGTSGLYDSGAYTAADAGAAYPIGPGFVSVDYAWSRSPETSGNHLVSRGVSLNYAITF